MKRVTGIHEVHILAMGLLHPLVHGMIDAPVGLRHPIVDTIGKRTYHLQAVVGRTSVDDNKLDVAKSLGQYTLDGAPELAGIVVIDGDDGESCHGR